MADGDALIRRVVGCMTGTSLDGIDVALGLVCGQGLKEMSVEYGGMVSREMPSGLREGLLKIAEGGAVTGLEVLRLRRGLGELHAEAVAELVEQEGGQPVDLVVAHGQTVWHAPGDEAGAGGGVSWQLFDPWPVVRRLGVPVGYDLRQADLIAGGQGAPITPVSDWVMYRGVADVVVNLGGIVNATWLHPDPQRVRGRDVYPCNLLLDGLCQRLLGESCDGDGAVALQGEVVPACMVMFTDAVDEVMRSGSLGREQFDGAWLDALASVLVAQASPSDVLRTACHMIALTVGTAVMGQGRRVVLAGGGVKNKALRSALVAWMRDVAGCTAVLSDEVGIPAEAREALGMAVLGALSWDGVPITLPGVTGAGEPGVAGAWVYPAGYER
ncbi:MAG: anhydro-N-acetylmuramic acid kinase [Planctomycetota bacterium]